MLNIRARPATYRVSHFFAILLYKLTHMCSYQSTVLENIQALALPELIAGRIGVKIPTPD